MKECIFCNLNPEESVFIKQNELFYARWDKNPVSLGHALIIPKKHTDSFFDLSTNEVLQLFKLLKEVRKIVNKKHKPDSYNLGINEGKEAGRTIDHLHLHLIPRYAGDVEDPQGGIRHIIPGKGNYLKNLS